MDVLVQGESEAIHKTSNKSNIGKAAKSINIEIVAQTCPNLKAQCAWINTFNVL